MKNILFIAALFVAIGSSRSYAQAPGDLIAQVPFQFQVGPTRLPAGTYIFHQNDNLLCVNRTDRWGTCIAGVAMTPPAKTEKGVLLFHRYENTYFLTSAWLPVGHAGVALSPGKAETELAKRLGPMQNVALRLK